MHTKPQILIVQKSNSLYLLHRGMYPPDLQLQRFTLLLAPPSENLRSNPAINSCMATICKKDVQRSTINTSSHAVSLICKRFSKVGYYTGADPGIPKGGCTIRGIHAQLFKIHHAHRQFSRGFSKSGMVTQLK